MRDFATVLQQAGARLARDGSQPVRLFHGRGHCCPGYEDVTVDLFPPFLLVTGHDPQRDDYAALAARLCGRLPGIDGVCLQVRQGQRSRTLTVCGCVPDEHVVSEQGLRYRVRLRANQNVGLFLDMAPARRWLRSIAAGARVLNLFAYTCAFSVAALAGGAHLVVNNDMNRRVLDWGRDNHRLNGHDARAVRMLAYPLFKCWPKVRAHGPYDIIVIDPPSRQHGSFVAERHYGRVLERLPTLAAPGARVLAALNSPFLDGDFLPREMARCCPDSHFSGALQRSDDFPERDPARGLKLALFRLR
ncbi:MAG: class I SAM-dependent methyltransferase [Pseudomonadales bacterium]